jgi:hypothetical protein
LSRQIGKVAIRSDNGLLLLINLVALTNGRLLSRVVRPEALAALPPGVPVGELSGEMYLDVMAEFVGYRMRWQLFEKLSPTLVVFLVDPEQSDEELAVKLSDIATSLLTDDRPSN